VSGFIFACIWAISANVIAMVHDAPKYRIHWVFARVLVLCLPFVIWRVGVDHGTGWMLAALGVAIFQLRLMLNHMGKQAIAKLKEIL